MSLLSDIFAGGAEGLLKGVKDVVSTFKADPLELAKLESELTKVQTTFELGMSQAQTRINEIEAASQDKFVSRWRPAIGWICGSAYFYHFILQPFLAFALAAGGHAVEAGQLPIIPVSELSVVLFGMLGIGAMRTFEKVKNGHSKD